MSSRFERPTHVEGRGGSTVWAPLPEGTQVGRYEIVSVVGSGGMGVVYRARDPVLSRDVALKLLHGHQRHFPEADVRLERLLREAKALAKLSHPNVVAAFDLGSYEGTSFLAMELVEGPSLRRWLERKPSRREVWKALVGAGRGLAAAHAAGILHRDFKPDNVVISSDGRARVLDFGIARLSGGEAVGRPAPAPAETRTSPPNKSTLTDEGTLMGTPGYMAPEQLAADELDERADQFSYAATAFYALCGHAPHDFEDMESYRLAIIGGKRAHWAADVPRRIRRVVERGLAARPEERYPTLAAMVDDLERAAFPRAGLAAAAAAFTAATVLALALRPGHAPAASCSLDGDVFATVWNAGRSSAVEHAFAAVGGAHAKERFALVAARLDAARAALEGARKDACEATHVRHEQSERVLGLRNACLADKRARLGHFVDLLEHADAPLLDTAPAAALELGAADDCNDTAALLGEEGRLPGDRGRRDAVSRLRATLDKIEAKQIAGRWQDALAGARAVVAEAETVHHKPTLARAHLAAADAERALDLRKEGQRDRLAAQALAAEVGLPKLRAEVALRQLAALVAETSMQHAEVAVPFVEADVIAAGDPPILRTQLLLSQSAIHSSADQIPEAMRDLDEAALLCKKLGAEAARICVSVTQERGVAYWQAGDLTRARDTIREQIVETERVFGARHPRLVACYQNLAGILEEAGAFDAALATIAEERKLVAELPASMQRPAKMDQLEGRIYMDAGKCERAVPLLRSALEWDVATHGERANDSTAALQDLGQCLVKIGRAADAVPYLQRWVDNRAKEDARKDWQGEASFELARALWQIPAGRPRALETARAAAVLYRADGARSDKARVEVERWLAERQ